MLAKILIINPPALGGSGDDMMVAISGDKEALQAIAGAAADAVEAGNEGTTAEITDVIEGYSIAYRFLRIPDELLRMSMADNN